MTDGIGSPNAQMYHRSNQCHPTAKKLANDKANNDEDSDAKSKSSIVDLTILDESMENESSISVRYLCDCN